MHQKSQYKQHSNLPEVMDFLDIAQQAMLGFGPQWRDNILSTAASNETGYPPYDLVQLDDNHYQVVIAVAGFEKSEMSITVENNQLIIKGQKNVSPNGPGVPEETSRKYIHKGIAMRKFTRTFMLAENVQVKDASVNNGLLIVDLEHVIPEEQKPKQIPIL